MLELQEARGLACLAGVYCTDEQEAQLSKETRSSEMKFFDIYGVNLKKILEHLVTTLGETGGIAVFRPPRGSGGVGPGKLLKF